VHQLTNLLTRPFGTGETTRDTGDAQRGLHLVSETRRNTGDRGDVRRMAHNPEVEGSNPSPATKDAGQKTLFEQGEGLLRVVCKLICKRRLRRVRSVLRGPYACRRRDRTVTVQFYSTL
jgi:hypothetical protein